MEDERSDEDRIIETLIMDGNKSLFEDMDFLPTRQSIYNDENIIPPYDDEVAQRIEWCRPHDITKNPVYFNPSSKQFGVTQGSLPDGTFLGTLLAICAYSKYDLIENIFASRPEDFDKYGIYTCRFYVDGEWVEVITDTNIPCLNNFSDGTYSPVYGTSCNPDELWVALVEKAFAKAMGSYEEIPNIKVQKALLHLTGGSVQQISLKEEVAKLDLYSEQSAWIEFKKRLDSDTLVLLMPTERKAGGGGSDTAGEGGMNGDPSASMIDLTASTTTASTAAGGGGGHHGKHRSHGHHGHGHAHGGDHGAAAAAAAAAHNTLDDFMPGMLYSVILCKDVGGYELVLLQDPWKNNGRSWTGEWSDTSNDWDLYPELLSELEKDPKVPWRRRRPNGYFWMSYRNVVKHFNKMFACKLFPNDSYHFYCVRGECRGRQAGGALTAIRDVDVVKKEAAASRAMATQKSSAAVVVDGDASWFNNPQFRITCLQPKEQTTVHISVVPQGGPDDDQGQGQEIANNAYITVASSAKSSTLPINLWDISTFDVRATDKTDGGVVRVKGQETSIWNLRLSPKNIYHIVPNFLRRGIEGDFILRVFSSNPILMESVPPLNCNALRGEWRRVGDLDTTGGGLMLTQSDGSMKENPKWCQNPQYHLEIADPFGKDEVYLKICVRRIDKHAGRAHGGGGGGGGGKAGATGAAAAAEQKKADATVGIVLAKADVLDDGSKKVHKRQPKQNILGEFIPLKESSLKKPKANELRGIDEAARSMTLEGASPLSGAAQKTILRKLHVCPDSSTSIGGAGGGTSGGSSSGGRSSASKALNAYHLVTSGASKTEACVFYPKLPRSWIPDGLIIVPCLSEKGVKGAFELEVYCSEKVYLNQLPETFSRTIAGDWTESSAGGSHLCPTWKRNPKYTLKFHFPVNATEPARVRLTLARHGSGWRSMMRKDTVGCMVGFYVFVNSHGEHAQVFESTFSPDDEATTDPGFVLDQLNPNEVYTIMPATFAENKVGSFVLSVMSEVEFTLSKEK